MIKFTAAREDAPVVADALEAHGAAAVTIESDIDETHLQNAMEETPLWTANRVAGLFAEGTDVDNVRAALRQILGRDPGAPDVEQLPDADWGRAWMEHYRPIQITPRLWICPSWCTPPDAGAINLLLDPGLAFGTGTHATTALCLRWLERHCAPGQTLIDYGCGSGILSIAVLKFGVERAVGIDIDPQALQTSRENAVRNGVGTRFCSSLPNEMDKNVQADIIVANILAGTLIDLAPELCRRVKPNGRLALSGLLTAQVEEVQKRYLPHFRLRFEERDGWALLAGAKLS
jgi:ribosomal protein L11 methyltransferase